MTAILGFVDKNRKCWLAGDRSHSDNDAYVVSSEPKVIASGPWLIGYMGCPKGGPVLKELFKVPPEGEKGLRAAFESLSAEENNWSAIVLGAGKIRYCYPNGVVTPILARTGAIGSGEHMALGALRGMLLFGEPENPKKTLRAALKIMAGYTHYVKPPFDVLCDS